MRQHNHRILAENHISPAQWAIMFATSYYLPAQVDQLVVEAQLESEENFSSDELSVALDECLKQGWISCVDQSRLDTITDVQESNAIEVIEKGLVLTDAGVQIKEEVGVALLETVEID